MEDKREKHQAKIEKPHVVILGAGASIACFPTGDKNGKVLPSMDNFIDVLGLAPLLDQTDIEYKNKNFEDIYSILHSRKEYTSIRQELETAVYQYFSLLV